MPKDKPPTNEELSDLILDLRGEIATLKSELGTVQLDHLNLKIEVKERSVFLFSLAADLEERNINIANHLKELLHQFGRSLPDPNPGKEAP